jgi:four helix bundle protein
LAADWYIIKMNTYLFSFEKLEVWQLARQLATEIYRTTRAFPVDERYGLVSQMRRAAISLTSNIAEGTTRVSPKDQAYFTTAAYSSLMEIFNHLTIAADLGYIAENHLNEYRTKIQPISVKLTNLKASQLKRIKIIE